MIIPTLFPYFLQFWYPYILLHFKCFLLLVYVIFFSSRRMHAGLWHLHCQQWLKNQTRASQKPTLFWMDTKPVLPELKTIAKFSVAKIAIPDSSSDTLLSLRYAFTPLTEHSLVTYIAQRIYLSLVAVTQRKARLIQRS